MLAIIGIIVLLLLLLLFVPIRYLVKGYRDEETQIHVDVHASWLLRLFRFVYIYPDKPYARVKFLFFTIYNSAKPAKPKKGKKKKREEKEKEEKEEQKEIKPLADGGAKIATFFDREISPPDTPKAPKTIFGKMKQFFGKIIYTIQNFCAKIKDTRLKSEAIVDKIKSFIEKIQSEEFKRAYTLCFTQLKRIWKNIRPKKVRANLVVGANDPAETGKILEFYSILYPIIGKHVNIMPDFDRFIVNGDFVIRGRITAFVTLWAALKVYRDENIRNVLKMFKDKNA